MELPELLAIGPLEDRMRAYADKGWALWERMNTPRFARLLTELGVFTLHEQTRNMMFRCLDIFLVSDGIALHHYALQFHIAETRVMVRIMI